MADAHGGFEEFFRASIARLVLFLIKIGARREEAEDAAQEAMTELYKDWYMVNRPEAWVRVAADRIYRNSAMRLQRAPDKAISGGWHDNKTLEDPDDLAILGQEQQQVVTVLRQLPHEQRRVMAWYYDGFSTAEIAKLTGHREATVRSHLRHARQKLARTLKQSDFYRKGGR